MRTTLTIDSRVLAEFKKRAAETHRTISSLIEDALREHLSRERDQVATKPLDFPIVGGAGLLPGADLSSNAALADFVDRADGGFERFREATDGAALADAVSPPSRGRSTPKRDC